MAKGFKMRYVTKQLKGYLDYLKRHEQRNLSERDLELALQVSWLIDIALLPQKERQFYYVCVVSYNPLDNKAVVKRSDGKELTLYLGKYMPKLKSGRLIVVDIPSGGITTFRDPEKA